jgi:hypothetical protein
MWFSWQLKNWRHLEFIRRRNSPRRRRPNCGPPIEALECRLLLTAYSAATAADLIADINAANKNGGTNTITLATNTTFDLTAVNNTTNGANGLPVIKGTDNLTIIGTGGDTIDRSTAAGTPAFRLFDVSKTSALTLEYVTLQNGMAQGSGNAADGGAVFNEGALTLSGVTVQNDVAIGADGATYIGGKKGSTLAAATDAAGGGIWSNGVLTLQDLTLPSGGSIHTLLQSNTARGGNGGIFFNSSNPGVTGGNALGGGIYVAGGTATLLNANLSNNTALGGTGGGDGATEYGGIGGAAFGGAMDIAAGTVALNGVVVTSNQAQGGTGGFGQTLLVNNPAGSGGTGFGGGINVAGGTVTLATVDLLSNTAVGGQGGNISSADLGSGRGGNAFGGGLSVGGGEVTLTNDTAMSNQALGGFSSGGPFSTGQPGTGYAGGIDIASAATVYLDSFTLTNTKYNSGNYGDIVGLYILRN